MQSQLGQSLLGQSGKEGVEDVEVLLHWVAARHAELLQDEALQPR